MSNLWSHVPFILSLPECRNVIPLTSILSIFFSPMRAITNVVGANYCQQHPSQRDIHAVDDVIGCIFFVLTSTYLNIMLILSQQEKFSYWYSIETIEFNNIVNLCSTIKVTYFWLIRC